MSNRSDLLDALPLRGATNPSTHAEGTSPGSFANAPDVGGPLAFSSPDTPGMPAPSDETAWDFLPDGWTRGADGFAVAPEGFEPITQLEHARLGHVTPEMKRVAEREPHLTAEQVRDEVAAGRHDHPGQPRAPRLPPRPDGDRPREPHQDQRQPRRLPRLERDRRGGREDALGGALGRRHRDGPVDRR